MRQKPLPAPPDDVPFWFITYSDVITLLMTFFILLLTFATNEPEMFERMQISVFGGGGASGLAGPAQNPLERDALLHRERPRAGRLTKRGSEIPPLSDDPALASLAEGIAGLDEDPREGLQSSHVFQMPLPLIVDDRLQITALGRQRLRMLARHLRKAPFELQIRVGQAKDVSKATVVADHLTSVDGVAPDKIGVGVHLASSPTASLELVLARKHKG